MRAKGSLGGLLLLSALALAKTGPEPSCRNIPGDVGWPQPSEWADLNQTVNGQLIKTVPLGSVCHYEPYGVYNKTECDALRQDWDFRHWKFKRWEMGQIQYVSTMHSTCLHETSDVG
jgi:hypothetical protein